MESGGFDYCSCYHWLSVAGVDGRIDKIEKGKGGNEITKIVIIFSEHMRKCSTITWDGDCITDVLQESSKMQPSLRVWEESVPENRHPFRRCKACQQKRHMEFYS